MCAMRLERHVFACRGSMLGRPVFTGAADEGYAPSARGTDKT